MKPLTLLEVGNLGGLVAMIIAMMIGVSFIIAIVVTFIIKAVYESKDNRAYSKKQLWQTVMIILLICGLISGMICGGML